MKQFLAKTFIMVLCVSTISCGKKDNKTPAPALASPILNLESFSNGTCLKVDAISNHINNGFNYPALVVTQDFKILSNISSNQGMFYTHSSFNYSRFDLNSFDFISVASQDECNSIQVKTSSGHLVSYDITHSTAESTTFHVREVANEGFAEHFENAFQKRPMPYQYELTWINAYTLEIKTWFKTLDVLCDSTKYRSFETKKLLSWNPDATALPQRIAIDQNYYNTISQVVTEPFTFGPEIFADEEGVVSTNKVYLTQDQLSVIYNSQIKDEYRYCN